MMGVLAKGIRGVAVCNTTAHRNFVMRNLCDFAKSHRLANLTQGLGTGFLKESSSPKAGCQSFRNPRINPNQAQTTHKPTLRAPKWPIMTPPNHDNSGRRPQISASASICVLSGWVCEWLGVDLG